MMVGAGIGGIGGSDDVTDEERRRVRPISERARGTTTLDGAGYGAIGQ
jgi:hypothetical protein